jgi:hypothetical protein
MMRILLLLVIAATMLAVSGCKSNTGSRQFIPGKGWVPSK